MIVSIHRSRSALETGRLCRPFYLEPSRHDRVASFPDHHCACGDQPRRRFRHGLANSLLYSRRAGLLTALGIGAGVTVHVGYSILGVGVLVRESLALFTALKLAGAAYRVFLGLRMLLAREDSVAEEAAGGAGVSSWAMLRSGFLTNALNPKTCLFVVSLFMQVIDPHTALPAQLGYGAFIALAHVAWSGLVACFLSSPAVRGRLLRFRRRIDQFFGALLVGFGVLLGAKSP